jgi:hypothetical protein
MSMGMLVDKDVRGMDRYIWYKAMMFCLQWVMQHKKRKNASDLILKR